MPLMMTGSSFGACLRIRASSAAMSGRRLSSTSAMYSAGVCTFSCPFIFIASSEHQVLRNTGFAHEVELALEVLDLVADAGRVLEAEVAGGLVHLLLEGLNEA